MDERTARIALACLVEPGTPAIAQQVAELGPHATLAAIRAGSSQAARAVPRDLAPGRVEPEDVAAMVATMTRHGIRVLVPGEPEFPTQLMDLAEPPLALWVRGPLDLRTTALRSVAIVGARACTAYGERATAEIAGGVAQAGWAVVSGGAFGIDAAAHRAALAVDGPTIAVLACGVDVAYPRAHDALLYRIADVGAVVSELPPGSLPLKHRFLARNRLIAALTRGTVVVEAARRSGAISTANRALELGRPVMCVPGPITAMASAGTNRLLYEQSARAACSAEDVVEVILGDRPASDRTGGVPRSVAARGDGPAAQSVLGDLSDEAAAVLAALPSRGGGVHLDTLAERTGHPAAWCLAQLGVLEICGLATRGARGWRRCG